jgi:hypothetical protein
VKRALKNIASDETKRMIAHIPALKRLGWDSMPVSFSGSRASDAV